MGQGVTTTGSAASGRHARFPAIARADDESVWAITCFVVRKEFRGQGLAARLLDAAVDHARTHGARVVEGYPVDTSAGKTSSNDLYHGALSSFVDAGFVEVARPGPTRPIVSLTVA